MNRILESGQYKALILRGEEIISLQEVMDLPWIPQKHRITPSETKNSTHKRIFFNNNKKKSISKPSEKLDSRGIG